MRIAAFADEIIAPTMGHADTRMLERVYGNLSPEELSQRLLLHARALRSDCIAKCITWNRIPRNFQTGWTTRNCQPLGIGAQGRNRTTDTGIFSPR
jgi:hypothetical protein